MIVLTFLLILLALALISVGVFVLAGGLGGIYVIGCLVIDLFVVGFAIKILFGR